MPLAYVSSGIKTQTKEIFSNMKPYKGKKYIKKTDKLRSKIIFNHKIALTFAKTKYYEVMGEDISTLPKRAAEKKKYSTPKRKRITKLLRLYKDELLRKSEGTWNILLGIYKKNQKAAMGDSSIPKQSNLLYLISSIPMLLLAYRSIRSNKGANTLASHLSTGRLNTKNSTQRRFLSKTFKAPDGLTNTVFKTTTTLLRQGKYPWGASRRIYVDKPGQPGKLRPITIPPFMDRVVQSAIRIVLEAIYEPWFEKRNRNFGFRPNKGVHDAITVLTVKERSGLFTAIEGDIKGAYDNVNRKNLISFLEKRITDRKFINLIKDRLDYQYFDSLTGQYGEDKKGIPQGGIDSPYLWNIYMLEFDDFVHSHLTHLLSSPNKKMRGNYKEGVVIESNTTNNLRNQRKKNIEYIKTLKQYIRTGTTLSLEKTKTAKIAHMKRAIKITKYSSNDIKQSIITLVKKNRIISHRKRNIETTDPNRRWLRFVYVRYADDWIILLNCNLILAEKIKADIKKWLFETLSAELADDKTLITDLRKKSAHFLGFELKTSANRKISHRKVASEFGTDTTGKKIVLKTKTILAKTAGPAIVAKPDRQRLISRLNMKGFCDEKGFPREMAWLSCLEPYAIVERYNSVLRGLCNYYAEFIKSPSDLYRWLYIIRYSCLKTLAQKYRLSIRKVLKIFYTPSRTGKTISVKVTHNFPDGVYTKEWKLLTAKECIQQALSLNRKKQLEDIYYSLEYNYYSNNIIYNTRRGAIPRVTDESYLENITWTTLRTSAQLDLPCCLCGSTSEINMHHIKHIRKVKYSQIPTGKPWLKLMALRNRKQIPVCRSCHMNVIHSGTHQGSNLTSLAPITFENIRLYDNRLAHVESYIKRGREYFGKSLIEKGWQYKEL